MAHNIELKLKADARDAKAGLEATARAAETAAEEVQKYNTAAASGDALGKVLQRHEEAFNAEAAAIRKTNQAMRERAKVEKEITKLEAAVAGNSLGSQLGEAARGALIAAPAAAAAGLVGLGMDASQRAARWEQAESRLQVTAGADAGRISSDVEQLAGKYGADASYLLEQAARLTKAGLSSEQTVKALESAVVAARGDVAQMEGLLDIMAESATRGTLEEDLMGRMEENGIELRKVLMQQFNMTKEEFDAALSAGKIDVSSYFEVIDQLTGKGTAAQQAAEAAAKSTAGLMNRIASEWDSILRNFGELLNEGLVKPLAGKVLPMLQKAGDWWRELMRDKTEDYISDIHPDYQKLLDEEAAGKAGPPAKTVAEIEAEKKLREEAEKRAEAFRDIHRERARLQGAEAWQRLSAAEKRTAIGRRTGLGDDVSLAGIDAALLSDPTHQKLMRGEEVSKEDLARAQMLQRSRAQLAELVKQEESALRQKETAEEMLRQAEKRQQMLQAELDGDKEKLALLQLEEQMEKRTAEYRKMGLSHEEAQQRAAQDVALQNQLAAKRQETPAQEPGAMKSTGWIRSSLASIGGGGVSMRQYESQGLKVAKDTATNTANIFKTAESILAAMNTRPAGAVPVLQ